MSVLTLFAPLTHQCDVFESSCDGMLRCYSSAQPPIVDFEVRIHLSWLPVPGSDAKKIA